MNRTKSILDFFTISFFLNSFDGDVFHNHANLTNGHVATIMANYEETPLAVGGFDSNNRTDNDLIPHAEIFNITTNSWSVIADYPFHSG